MAGDAATEAAETAKEGAKKAGNMLWDGTKTLANQFNPREGGHLLRTGLTLGAAGITGFVVMSTAGAAALPFALASAPVAPAVTTANVLTTTASSAAVHIGNGGYFLGSQAFDLVSSVDWSGVGDSISGAVSGGGEVVTEQVVENTTSSTLSLMPPPTATVPPLAPITPITPPVTTGMPVLAPAA